MLKSKRPMRRRRFVTLVAMGSAALLTSPLSRAMAAIEKNKEAKPPLGRHASTPAIRKEVANQVKSTADQLRVIRAYKLPPGSPMAFTFVPEIVSRKRGRS